MGTYTCQILIGGSHTYHGGILPSYQMFLSENSRAAWILRKMPSSPEEIVKEVDRIAWIPAGPETIMRDGMMMIAYHILREPNFVKKVNEVVGASIDKHLDLNDFGWDKKRKEWSEKLYDKLNELYKSCKLIEHWPNMIITILGGSSLENSRFENEKWNGGLDVLNEYNINSEVCISRNVLNFQNTNQLSEREDG